MKSFPNHARFESLVRTTPEMLFEHLDDHKRLSSHMSESSWTMGGGKMAIEVDENQGKAVGSHIRLAGRVCGLEVMVEEVLTQRTPPTLKVWETIGTPRLIVIGAYRMGFRIEPQANGSKLTVFIDYAPPESGMQRFLGRLFGKFYAQWCTEQMVRDAVAHFEVNTPASIAA